jgi:hypothetical protein
MWIRRISSDFKARNPKATNPVEDIEQKEALSLPNSLKHTGNERSPKRAEHFEYAYLKA